MGDGTGIEWADATWNPTVGCTKVSAGCDHCYAETFVNRFAGSKGFPNRFEDMLLRDDRTVLLPLRWAAPRRIFVNSMSDLFHADVPDWFIARVFAVMALAPRHDFQLLTKRHARMRSLLSSDLFWLDVQNARAVIALERGLSSMEPMPWPLPNVWLGVSVESQKWETIRGDALRETPAAVRFYSAEPLLGPITANLDGIDWVIVGGESGPGARPMHPDWARSLRDQCAAAGVPFLFKQWGEWAPTLSNATHRVTFGGESYPDPATCLMSNEELISRVGKKAAGRVLDGRTWDEYPAATR